MNANINTQTNADQPSDETMEYHANQFTDVIAEQGYKRGTIASYRSRATLLCSLMADRNLTPKDLDETTAVALFDTIIAGSSKPRRKYNHYCLQRFRDYLIDHAGAPPRPIAPVDRSPRAYLCREYQVYLQEQRGLSERSVYQCLRYFDRFMTFKFGDGFGDTRCFI